MPSDVGTRADPTFADARYNLSDLLDEQGRVEAAIECLRTSLRAAPYYADAMFNLALPLQRKNQYAEAADYWRRYLASDYQSEWATRARRSLKFCEMQINLIASAWPFCRLEWAIARSDCAKLIEGHAIRDGVVDWLCASCLKYSTDL